MQTPTFDPVAPARRPLESISEQKWCETADWRSRQGDEGVCECGVWGGHPVIHNTTFDALKPSAATPAPSAATACTIWCQAQPPQAVICESQSNINNILQVSFSWIMPLLANTHVSQRVLHVAAQQLFIRFLIIFFTDDSAALTVACQLFACRSQLRGTAVWVELLLCGFCCHS